MKFIQYHVSANGVINRCLGGCEADAMSRPVDFKTMAKQIRSQGLRNSKSIIDREYRVLTGWGPWTFDGEMLRYDDYPLIDVGCAISDCDGQSLKCTRCHRHGHEVRRVVYHVLSRSQDPYEVGHLVAAHRDLTPRYMMAHRGYNPGSWLRWWNSTLSRVRYDQPIETGASVIRFVRQAYFLGNTAKLGLERLYL